MRGVVQIETRTHRCICSEDTHQRLSAMVSGANANVGLIEYLAEVVRMNAAKGERKCGAAKLWIGWAVDCDVIAKTGVQRVEYVCAQFDFVLTNVVHA